jgi:hypothetical protein
MANTTTTEWTQTPDTNDLDQLNKQPESDEKNQRQSRLSCPEKPKFPIKKVQPDLPKGPPKAAAVNTCRESDILKHSAFSMVSTRPLQTKGETFRHTTDYFDELKSQKAKFDQLLLENKL